MSLLPENELLDEEPLTAFNSSVLNHGSITWAVNLEWYVPEENKTNSKLRSYMSQFGFDLSCLRKGKDKQYGLGSQSNGHKAGLPALASVIADNVEAQNWHGIFEAENGFLHIVVREHSIIPKGDKFFGLKEEALASFEKENQHSDLWERFAPKSWNIPNTTELLLSDVLKEFEYNGKLSSPDNIQKLAFVGVLVLVGAFYAQDAYQYIKGFLSDPAPVVEKNEPVKRGSETIKLTRTGKLIDPESFLNICIKSVEKHYRGLPGWKPQSITCADEKLTLTWSQSSGSMKDLLEQVLLMDPEASVNTATGQRFTASLNISGFKTQKDQELYTEATALFEAHRHLYGLGKKDILISSAQTSIEVLPEGQTLSSRKMAVNLVSGFAIGNIAEAFSIPGLEITKATWKPSNNEWAINASIYVQ